MLKIIYRVILRIFWEIFSKHNCPDKIMWSYSSSIDFQSKTEWSSIFIFGRDFCFGNLNLSTKT
jgi:hypothetical protein